MEKYKPTATLFLDTRKGKSNNKYPLKLTIYCRPDKKRYTTNIDLSADEWEKLNGHRLRDENLKEKRIKTQMILTRAERILEELSPFSFDSFKKSIFYQRCPQN